MKIYQECTKHSKLFVSKIHCQKHTEKLVWKHTFEQNTFKQSTFAPNQKKQHQQDEMNETIMSKRSKDSESVASDITAEPKEAGNVSRSESASEPKRDDGHEEEALSPIVKTHVIKDSVS